MTLHMMYIWKGSLGNTMYRGSDVRIGSGFIFNPTMWPRVSMDAQMWDWKVAASYRLKTAHINKSELHAYLATIRWRLRKGLALRVRMLHSMDSYVCLSVAAKGRTSSRLLQKTLSQINSLLLAASSTGSLLYVRT